MEKGSGRGTVRGQTLCIRDQECNVQRNNPVKVVEREQGFGS